MCLFTLELDYLYCNSHGSKINRGVRRVADAHMAWHSCTLVISTHMVNDILNGLFKLVLLVSVLLILFAWSIGIWSANALLLPVIAIALISLLTSRPFR